MEIAGLIDAVLDTGQVPGVAVMVGTSSEVREAGVAGVRRLGMPDSLELTDRFHIGSCAKGMTATLIGCLVDDGVIGWDTTVGDIFGSSAYQSATMTQLLRHEAGLPPFEEDEEFETLPALPADARDHRRAFAEHVLTLPPNSPIGAEFRYSNAGFGIATAMIEAATDAAWEDLIAARVWAPLDLDAGFGWPASHDPAAPWGHMVREGALKAHDPADGYELEPSIAPAGDVQLPLPHFFRWLQANCAGLQGQDFIVQPATLQQIHTPGLRAGLGWGSSDIDGLRYSAHTGSAGTFFVVGVISADADRVLAVAANAGHEAAEEATLPMARTIMRSWVPA